MCTARLSGEECRDEPGNVRTHRATATRAVGRRRGCRPPWTARGEPAASRLRLPTACPPRPGTSLRLAPSPWTGLRPDHAAGTTTTREKRDGLEARERPGSWHRQVDGGSGTHGPDGAGTDGRRGSGAPGRIGAGADGQRHPSGRRRAPRPGSVRPPSPPSFFFPSSSAPVVGGVNPQGSPSGGGQVRRSCPRARRRPSGGGLQTASLLAQHKRQAPGITGINSDHCSSVPV